VQLNGPKHDAKQRNIDTICNDNTQQYLHAYHNNNNNNNNNNNGRRSQLIPAVTAREQAQRSAFESATPSQRVWRT